MQGAPRRRVNRHDRDEHGGRGGVSIQVLTTGPLLRIRSTQLWVPNSSSMSGDLGIFVDRSELVVASEAKTGGDAAMITGRGGQVAASAGAP